MSDDAPIRECKRFVLKLETNERMICTRMDYIFWKRRTEIFFQPSFNDKKTYIKMYTRVLIDIDKQRSDPVFLWSVLSRRRFLKEFFFFVFVLKFIVHFLLHYDSHYPSFNKLSKTFIKVVKTSSFAFEQFKKDVPAKKTYMRLIRSSGVENCLFLRARGWGIDFLACWGFSLHLH